MRAHISSQARHVCRFDRLRSEAWDVGVQVLDLHFVSPGVVGGWTTDSGVFGAACGFKSRGVFGADPNSGSGMPLVAFRQEDAALIEIDQSLAARTLLVRNIGTAQRYWQIQSRRAFRLTWASSPPCHRGHGPGVRLRILHLAPEVRPATYYSSSGRTGVALPVAIVL